MAASGLGEFYINLLNSLVQSVICLGVTHLLVFDYLVFAKYELSELDRAVVGQRIPPFARSGKS